MLFKSVEDLKAAVGDVVCNEGGVCKIADVEALRGEVIERLAFNAGVNKDEEIRELARCIIKSAAAALGIYSASIQGLYEAMGKGEVTGLTVPAINIRGLTYDTARAVFRAGAKNKSNAFIFEIAKSEIGYTAQRPAEYTVSILAAAIKEGYKGPVFIQGDHFQVNAKSYEADKAAEIEALKALIKEAIEGEFYNIDIDASTLVDLSRPTVLDQQRPNFEITAFMTSYIRDLEPDGVTVSIGGEIGEVGSQNSTEEELRAFMDGYLDLVGERHKGISKISVQTGTSHGGVVLPDGSIAKVSVDFDTIEQLSKVSREVYGLSGVVQHGASTLPDDAFHLFREKEASEVHLATGFQNMVYDSASFPAQLKEEIYSYLKENMKAEWGEGVTEEQFLYKTRKKGFGPFKEKMWSLPKETRDAIGAELEDRFDYLFKQLNSVDTLETVGKHVG
ncbi:FIG01164266: hypothetical protein [hydrothermal vent metagenome]|uniref:Aldolase n=1 Tax=hydrothermal vent metagenome TaxID=652676 RepID=A0A3B0QUX8_9ZZZZ